MSNFTILLPPSEGKASGGDPDRTWRQIAKDPDCNAFPRLNPARRKVIAALKSAQRSLPEADLQKLFNVKDDNLAAAIAANRAILSAELLPAIQRYTGVMFDFLDYPSMPPDDRHTFDTHALIFSGVWGLLRPTDLIPDYKLKIDASLPNLGRVSAFWKPHLSRVLNPILAGQIVWDLLPGAHRTAWDGKAKSAVRWQVKFVERVESRGKVTYRTVNHWSKALKGALVRHLCAHPITDVDALADFEHPLGYVYDPTMGKRSKNGGEVVFVKSNE